MIEFNIYGCSDDLIEIDGDISEELSAPASDDFYVACYDGTLLKAEYDSDGIWRFKVYCVGWAYKDLTPCIGDGSEDYSDIVYFSDNSEKDAWDRWFVAGDEMQAAR